MKKNILNNVFTLDKSDCFLGSFLLSSNSSDDLRFEYNIFPTLDDHNLQLSVCGSAIAKFLSIFNQKQLTFRLLIADALVMYVPCIKTLTSPSLCIIMQINNKYEN